jgi:hypothetical protein
MISIAASPPPRFTAHVSLIIMMISHIMNVQQAIATALASASA